MTKKTSSKLIFVFAILGLVFLTGSCKKEDLIENDPVQNTNLNDQTLNSFAKAFSLALNDQAVKDFVIERCKKKENGDYEFLYVLAKDETLPSGISLKERLNQLDQDHELSFYTRSEVVWGN